MTQCVYVACTVARGPVRSPHGTCHHQSEDTAVCCMFLTHACHCCVQPAVAQMDGVLGDPARAQRLQSHLPWLEILARLLRLPDSGQTTGYPMLASDPKVVEATSGALLLCELLQICYTVQVPKILDPV